MPAILIEFVDHLSARGGPNVRLTELEFEQEGNDSAKQRLSSRKFISSPSPHFHLHSKLEEEEAEEEETMGEILD